jgi:hypothetical protein
MPAAEHIERQIAVGVVIAVEETLLPRPVQVVGGVEIEGDLRRRRMSLERVMAARSDRDRQISKNDASITARPFANP